MTRHLFYILIATAGALMTGACTKTTSEPDDGRPTPSPTPSPTPVYTGTKGTVAVDSTSGRKDCDWVQLWAGGPRWATVNVGSTISQYTALTLSTKDTTTDSEGQVSTLYCTENCGGLYAWGEADKNAHIRTWSQYGGNSQDIASTLWGSLWTTPSIEQLMNLIGKDATGVPLSEPKTIITWCSGERGHQAEEGCTLSGYKISGLEGTEYADNSIFLPTTGQYSPVSGDILWASTMGMYWSKTQSEEKSYNLYFNDKKQLAPANERRFGYAIRAVLAE